METAVLLVQCPDRKGIVARVSDFLFRHDVNIIQSDQHSTDPEGGRFFMRVEFYFDELLLPASRLEADFAPLARQLDATFDLFYASRRMRVGVLVSRFDHCLFDLLYRWKSGELPVDIPCVVSNHEACREIVERYGIPFHYLPLAPEQKRAQEQAVLRIMKDNTDLLVLARYMQILSGEFLSDYGRDVINIHHSFLPSFKGADPYRQACERGVKIIGATAHYVTANLDEGPIIEQMVERVTHRDNVDDLRRRGRNLEKTALAKAIHLHVEHRVMRHEHKTIVFE
jgi:formyltetrahydrofolate deformylase